MGFLEDLSEVVWKRDTKEDADFVLAFFRYVESLAEEDFVDIDLPEEIYTKLISIQKKYHIESLEKTYWQTNLLLHQFVYESMPVGRRKELIRKASKVSNLLSEFELQVALLWCEDWEKTIPDGEIDLELMPVMGTA